MNKQLQQKTYLSGRWNDVGVSLPPQGQKVLITYKNKLWKNKITLAARVEANIVDCNCDYDCDCDYDEISGTYYLPPGWWEIADNHDEFQMMLIDDEITHWMFLPSCP